MSAGAAIYVFPSLNSSSTGLFSNHEKIESNSRCSLALVSVLNNFKVMQGKQLGL